MGRSYWQLASAMIEIATKNLNVIIADSMLVMQFLTDWTDMSRFRVLVVTLLCKSLLKVLSVKLLQLPFLGSITGQELVRFYSLSLGVR